MTDTPETDLMVVWTRRVAAGDAAAFESVFRALHAPLLRYAETMLGDPASASDAVQDAFIRIWEGRERLDPQRSIKAFAYRTVRNLCLNRLRDGQAREALLAEKYRPGTSSQADPEEAFAGSELGEKLNLWIDELPERQREALVLSRFQGLSHEEVAETMGVSARTVNNHLVRALRAVRDRVRAFEPHLLD